MESGKVPVAYLWRSGTSGQEVNMREQHGSMKEEDYIFCIWVDGEAQRATVFL